MENEEKKDKKSIIVENEKGTYLISLLTYEFFKILLAILIIDNYILEKSDAPSQTKKMGNTKNVQPQKSDTTNTGNDELIHSRQV